MITKLNIKRYPGCRMKCEVYVQDVIIFTRACLTMKNTKGFIVYIIRMNAPFQYRIPSTSVITCLTGYGD